MAIIWAGPTLAQPADRLRRIGIFHAYDEVDPVGQASRTFAVLPYLPYCRVRRFEVARKSLTVEQRVSVTITCQLRFDARKQRRIPR